MKTIVILFLSTFLCVALAEPLRYRFVQPIQASARQTDGGGFAVQAELGESTTEASGDQEPQSDEEVTEPSLNKNAPAPAPVPPQVYPPQVFTASAYPPQGWRPLGQLLVLPVAVRENVDSTTTVESTTFNDDKTTEKSLTTESQETNGQQMQEVETSEPKMKQFSAAHKKPSPTIVIIKGKKVGELKLEAKSNANQESNKDTEENEADSNSSTTENADEATTTSTIDPKSENLETTAEPDSEAVDVEKSNEEGKKVNNAQAPLVPQAGFFIQLPDGSFQRIFYTVPPAAAQATFIPQQQSANNNFQIQQLNQAPNYPFGFNPITNPRIVTFSSQYNAW